jgi:hypothetical protein
MTAEAVDVLKKKDPHDVKAYNQGVKCKPQAIAGLLHVEKIPVALVVLTEC